jgi:hypothetical protein
MRNSLDTRQPVGRSRVTVPGFAPATRSPRPGIMGELLVRAALHPRLVHDQYCGSPTKRFRRSASDALFPQIPAAAPTADNDHDPAARLVQTLEEPVLGASCSVDGDIAMAPPSSPSSCRLAAWSGLAA